jgi:hypothetical protein
MKRPLHVLALMFLTTSLALVGCGDSENKGNGDGGVPTSEVGPAVDTGVGTIDTQAPIDLGKTDAPITTDTSTVDVPSRIDAPAIDAPAIDGPALHDTGAVEVDHTLDTGRVDTGAGVDSSPIDTRQNDARRAA